MGSCPQPGDAGYVAGVFQAFALNIALRLAAEVGLGLPLFNALRERFPDLERGMIGEITSIIGEGVRAGLSLNVDENMVPIDPSALPTVSADFHPGESGDRLVAGVDITYTDTQTGTQQTRRVFINTLEILTPADLMAEAEALFEAEISETDPRAAEMVRDVISHLVFLATRY